MKNTNNYQIIDSIDASIYWKDLSGKYLGCNEYMMKMAGMSRDQIIGSTDHNLPWKDQANKIREIDLLVINNLKKYETEEYAVIKNKTNKIFLSSKSPLFDENNKIMGVIGVSIDITHNKQFEQELVEIESTIEKYATIKTRFLKNISHEARIPMGSVLSISEQLNDNWDKFDDKTKRENMGLIFKEATRLSNFILNTFDLSNFLKNEIQLELKVTNFSKFLEKIINQYQKSFCDARVDIEMNHFDDFSFSFDQKLIAKVIKNLIMNAIEYSPKKKKITIGLYKSYLKNTDIPAIQCCITDEGIGIPDNEFDTIFEPFTESSRTSSKACGVGLGLSLCKEIIDAHSGNIWVEKNLLNSGSTFNFSIPTNLLSLSNNFKEDHQEIENNNIIKKKLTIKYEINEKQPFALIGISPFNSYFSVEKILEICEWIHNEYDDFAIFIPDEISRYTFEALGYTQARIGMKIKKQDNYTINKVSSALSEFYQKHPEKEEVKIHAISKLKQNNIFGNLYQMYSKMFLNDKLFRQNCLEVVEWVLLNNNTKDVQIEDFHKNIAVQYFLYELPVMTNSTDILKIQSCDFVYHSMPKFLKHLYLSKDLVSPKQRFLILR